MKRKQYIKGHFIPIGLAVGLPIGIPIGMLLGHIALGPAIGLPIGLIIGAILEKRLNTNPIELSKDEKIKRKKVLWTSVILGFVILVLLIEWYLTKIK
jgi:hypothetical protein